MYKLTDNFFKIVLISSVGMTIISGSLTSNIVKKAKCRPPDISKLQDVKWEFADSEEHVLYFPIGSKKCQNEFSRIFSDVGPHSLSNPHELNKFCLRLQLNVTDWSDQTFSGYGKTTNACHFNCNKIRTGIFDCRNNYGFTHKDYVTDGDYKTWVFANVCWESGVTGWTVVSKMPNFPQELETRALKHAESLGYNSTDFRRVPYDKCSIYSILCLIFFLC